LERFDDAITRGHARFDDVSSAQAAEAEFALQHQWNLVVTASEHLRLEAASRFATFLSVYGRLGFVTEESRESWHRKLTHMFAPNGQTELATTADQVQPPLALRPGALRRVVLPSSERSQGLRLTSCELYTECTIVRWHFDATEAYMPRLELDNEADRQPEFVTIELALEDDLGRAYARIASPHESTVDLKRVTILLGYSVFGAAYCFSR
jgi:hypothetical protein